MTHTPGAVVVTYHHTPSGPIARPLIIWDAAYEGDQARWLVQWATSALDAAATNHYHEAHKPHGRAFVLHHLNTHGLNWEAEGSTDVGSFGPAGLVTIGHYEPSDPGANSIEVMAAAAGEQVVADPATAITRLGETLVAARIHQEAVSARLREAVREGAVAGLSEKRMAAMARVTRMSIRSWLGK